MMKTTFLDDVAEQPRVLRNLVRSYESDLQSRLREAVELIKSRPLTLAVGMGSSAFASELLALRLNQTGLKVLVCDASELYHYGQGIMGRNAIMLAVSQSGESAEPCLAAAARPESMPLISITNDPESRLGRKSDIILPLLAGYEGGTTSKTFVATMAVLHLLADAVLGEAVLSLDKALELAEHMQEMIAGLGSEVERLLGQFGDFSSIVFTSRGPGLATARQGALITQEMTQIPAVGISAGQFRHGPIEAAGPHLLMVVFAPMGRTTRLLIKLAQDTADYGSPTWLVTDTSVQVAARENLFVSRLPHVPESLFPLLSIIVPELLGTAIARRKGFEPGKLRRISKVTDFE
ncbi:MAG: SIS domain-containing protein [Firmicutes bacterium]|nr:SIS domain-containing protein [Bacillota bacterium]